ncbi:PLP-dependent aminotransferase family protein [Streptomyces sp. TLI_171]|uniref:MocR-like transcription factor YczR n=1 Tax=Streptomyces sp. TLI_171 TaxID=1938859 RepID=UPI000C1A0633|nr:PLP-dependent aminotransferase family protein [Streptomyces sp. TLI_171]RKE21862.1 GntR family transcriptional regulator [Streptomyces sp. TLI_171]
MAEWHSTLTPHALARQLPPSDGRRPAYRALAAQVSRLVADGRLPVGTRLPAERELAAELRLSRTTVAAAYEALRTDGFLHSRRGAGSWTALPEGTRPPADALHPVPPDQHGALLDLGLAAPTAPPQLAEAAAHAVAQLPAYTGGHGNYPTGLPALREAVARRFTERGLPTGPEQVLITTGAMSALHLAHQALLTRGDRVAVEAPSYANTLRALDRLGARLVPVPFADPAGGPTRWDLAQWQRVLRGAAPKLASTVPDFQNPTGALIDEDQRRALLAHARAAGTTVIADETCAELGWGVADSALPRPLAALDRDAQVITVGSAGKLLWPGLRIGWLRAQPSLVRKLAADRALYDLGTPVLDQLVAARLLTDHLPAVRAARHEQLRSTAEEFAHALARRFPAWRFTLPPGGLALWVATPGTPATALARAGERVGVRIASGARFGVDGAFEEHLRLPLTLPAARVDDALDRVAEAAELARAERFSTADPEPASL